MANDFVKAEEERLTGILMEFSDEFSVAIEDSAKLSASNFLLRVGAKATLAADGYMAAAVQIASAAIIRAVDQGYIKLAKGKDTDEAIQARLDERAEYQREVEARAAARNGIISEGLGDMRGGPGAYL